MRPNRKPRYVLSAALALAAAVSIGATTARAQAAAGPYRGNYPGYYYSPGGYSGGYYFNPGYYANPAPAPAVAPAAASARPNYYYGSYSGRNAYSTATRHPAYNPEDWSTGRTNYPIPLTKPWMMPLRY